MNILELGSGAGLFNLVAWYRGARVCITDQGISYPPHLRGHHYLIMALHLSICLRWPRGHSSLLPITERNILLNRLQLNVSAAELDWCAQYCSNLRRGSMKTYNSFFPRLSHCLNRNVWTLSSRRMRVLRNGVYAASLHVISTCTPFSRACIRGAVPLQETQNGRQALFRIAQKEFHVVLGT